MPSRDAPSTSEHWQGELASGLEVLNLPLPSATQARLLDFVELLLKWNRAYNLIARSTADKIVAHHILDSLSLARFLYGETALDLGTGAGLPGIPLALAKPAIQFTLIDSNGKKARFAKHAVMTLKLANVEVISKRIQDYRPRARFDTVVCRAFSKLEDFVRLSEALCAPTGRLLAMKGIYPNEELQNVPAHFRIRAVEPVSVPGLQAERHVVDLSRHQASDQAQTQ